jgi:hypothetical protein
LRVLSAIRDPEYRDTHTPYAVIGDMVCLMDRNDTQNISGFSIAFRGRAKCLLES